MKRLILLLLLFAVPAFGASGPTRIIADQPLNLATGTTDIPPVNVPGALSKLTLKFKRDTTATPTYWTDPATVLDVRIFISYDNGATYLSLCGVKAPGGIVVSVAGTQITDSVINCSFNQGSNRKLKATVVVTNGPLVSVLNLEAN